MHPQMLLPMAENSINAALTEIVRALGGYQAVGNIFWPEMAVDAAGRKLANHLNEHRAERLTPDQVLFLFVRARQCGFHASKRWFDEATGYIPTDPLEPEDERAKLQRAFVDATAGLNQIMNRLERLSAGPSLKVAK